MGAPAPAPTRARPAAAPARREPFLAWPAIAGGVALLATLICFPPMHVVSRHDGGAAAARGPEGKATAVAFDPVAFAGEFWIQRLSPAAASATEASALLADLRRDPAAAVKAHAHRVGLGNAAYYFARGAGRVTAIERGRLIVEIDGAIIAVRTGPVFGNVVRDGCGLLEVNQVPGLTEFNALSAELNRLVEEKVQPALKGGAVAVGATLAFAGCAEAPETLPAGGPLLTFIPVSAEAKP